MREKGDSMNEIDERLEQEFSNEIYDVVSEAIRETSVKYNYKDYDIAKLVLAINNYDYDYLINKNDFREQVKMLNEYFEDTYKHHILTFIILKKILSFKEDDYYNLVMMDWASAYSIIKTGQNASEDYLDELKGLIDNKEYDKLMSKIEADEDLSYSLAIVYDRIINYS